ncbi:MAG: hypothetical protein ACTS5I_16540, partial [Rhodanobacter sp.]
PYAVLPHRAAHDRMPSTSNVDLYALTVCTTSVYPRSGREAFIGPWLVPVHFRAYVALATRHNSSLTRRTTCGTLYAFASAES